MSQSAPRIASISAPPCRSRHLPAAEGIAAAVTTYVILSVCLSSVCIFHSLLSVANIFVCLSAYLFVVQYQPLRALPRPLLRSLSLVMSLRTSRVCVCSCVSWSAQITVFLLACLSVCLSASDVGCLVTVLCRRAGCGAPTILSLRAL